MSLKVLFVCVENSCRSQIAQALARKLGIDAESAGSRPSGKVNPKALQLMPELASHKSKAISDVPAEGWDYVVTMGCGDACPYVPAKARLDWKIPDPKDLPLPEFQAVIDLIKEHVRELAAR
jgi:arsenate reductase (thioredoxin)